MSERTDTEQSAGLPLPVGKVIAVHLSYASRAAQRGRRPAAPSYFLKPASSLAVSGGVIERPDGTDLLAFEGEVALVIGTPARWVTPTRAWEYVGWVTAANDAGLYDLRANDAGSNLRAKGRDGYTPLGPAMIDARAVRPDQLRVRTWRNGELVQSDTTGAMIFPLPQLIADLSQHVTLVPGDIILTGTPAGSSVMVPGDVIEVEVDAPDAAGAPSSGRLSTRVVNGRGDFDPAIGSLPSADDRQRAEAWGSREAAGLPPEADEAASQHVAPEPVGTQGIPDTPDDAPTPHHPGHPNVPDASGPGAVPTFSPLPDDLRRALMDTPVAALAAELRRRGLNAVCVDGVHAQKPGTKLVGVARTLRFIPGREDLFASYGGGYNAQKRAFDQVRPGEVIVIEARGEPGSGTMGDILALRALSRGAAGVVTDGGVRDYATVAALGLPVFCQGPHPAVLGRKHVPWDTDVTIACGGAAVQPGDIIVGDDDGVLVIPAGLAEEAVRAAQAAEQEDAWIAQQVQAGNPLDGLFPMNAAWRSRFEAGHLRAKTRA